MREETNNKKSQKSNIFTKETLGVVLVLFATLCMVCLITREKVFFTPGRYVNAFLLGLFGYFAYAVIMGLFILGVTFITGKKIPISTKYKVYITCIFFLAALLSQIIFMDGKAQTFKEYISLSYSLGEGGILTCSAGGFFIGLISYPVASLLTTVGASVVVGIGLVVLVTFFVKDIVYGRKNGVEPRSKNVSSTPTPNPQISVEGEREYPVSNVAFVNPVQKQKLFVSNQNDFELKSKKDLAKDQSELKMDFSSSGLGVARVQNAYTDAYAEEMKRKTEYIKTAAAFNLEEFKKRTYGETRVSQEIPLNNTVSQESETDKSQNNSAQNSGAIPMYEHQTNISEAEQNAQTWAEKYVNNQESEGATTIERQEEYHPFIEENVQEEKESGEEITSVEQPQNIEEGSVFAPRRENPVEIPQIEEVAEEHSIEQPAPTNVPNRARRDIFSEENVSDDSVVPSEPIGFTSRAEIDGNLRRSRISEKNTEKVENTENKVEQEKKTMPADYVYAKPPLDLLEKGDSVIDESGEKHEENKEKIRLALEELDVEAQPTIHQQGPSVTRYEYVIPRRVPWKKILGASEHLQMRLCSQNKVRIEAPIPGKDAIGIEVANKIRTKVLLRNLLEESSSVKQDNGKLIFAVGKDLVGKSIMDNLAKGPHYLVAGATGSGKSVFLDVMIISLIMRYGPQDLRLILVDPKSVGFKMYNHIPHLLIDEIITEHKKALAMLSWAQIEMERRYKVFDGCSSLVSDIEAYNDSIAGTNVPKMPRIVIIIDELADLMEECKKEMEAKIRALAQKSRAAGIHLVLATQRPSVDIITGTIKANLPSRVALKVMNTNDSQTILGQGGAEKLLGNGDMLYKNSAMPDFARYQGALISATEKTNIVNYIIQNNESYFDDSLKEFLDRVDSQNREETAVSIDNGDEGDAEVNELFIRSLELCITSGSASISQLQRRFQIGYARAGGLIDKMERMGYISGNEGSKARKVLITRDEFEQKYGPINGGE